MPKSYIKAKVRKQMKFYRWLVVEINPESRIYQILPCETKKEAEDLVDELAKFRGVDKFMIFDARVDDDWNLFYSATSMGYPLESGEGVA